MACTVTLVALNLLVGGLRVVDDNSPSATAVALPTTTTTTSTTTTTTTTTTIEQPTVDPAPVAYVAPDPPMPIGTLQIPAIGLDTDIFDGATLATIDYGPSHYPGTALPGHLGNLVLAGHRVTHSHPFRHLDLLGPGDVAILTTSEGTFTYQYVSTEVVTPDQIEILGQTRDYSATFFGCHPPGSASYRIVVHWRLTGAPAPGQPDPS